MTTTAFFNAVRPMFGGRLTQSQVDGTRRLLAITDGLQITHRAYTLATAQHETDGAMQPVREKGTGDGPDPDPWDDYLERYDTGRLAAALGNTPEADGDGVRYAGRGYVQITGLANYKKASAHIGVDLVNNPEAALNPEVAGLILVRGMRDGWFTGAKLSDYLPGDYVNARRVVNGTDMAHRIARLARGWEAALRHLDAAAPETTEGLLATLWSRLLWVYAFIISKKGKRK